MSERAPEGASTDVLYSLIKFGEKEHIEQLRQTGKLYMRRLADFQAMEDTVGRGDRHDGLSAQFQPEKVIVKLGDITLEGLVGPVRVQRDVDAEKHVFCMVAATSRRLEVHRQGEPLVPPQNVGLGKYAVLITNVTEFIRRVTAAAERANLPFMAGLVDYVDPKTHHGEVGAFRKFDSYADQCEWRIVLPPSGEGVYWFDVGSLEDISVLAPADAVSDGLKIQFPL